MIVSWSYGLVPGLQNFSPPVKIAHATGNAWQIRQEINITDAYFAATSGNYATSSAIINIDTTKYSGTATYYLEVEASSSSAINPVVFYLRNPVTGATVTSTSTSLGTSYYLYRSNSFTPTSRANDYVLTIGNASGGTKGVKAARIVILQNFPDTANQAATSTETQIEIGNNETGKSNTSNSALTNPKYWGYSASKWDGTITAYAEVTFKNSQVASSTTYTVPGSYTYNVSPGTSYTKVELWGAGGGGRCSTSNAGGGGGGGGAFALSTTTPLAGSSHTVVVAATTTCNTTTANNSTYDTTTVVAAGGTGSGASATGGAGGTTAASTGDVKFAGGLGGNALGTNDTGGGGGGAAGPNGAGGGGSNGPSGATTAGGGGGGGNGGSTASNTQTGGSSTNGGTGGNGGASGAVGSIGVSNTNGAGGGGGSGSTALTGGPGGSPGGGGGGGDAAQSGTNGNGGRGQARLTETNGAVGFALEKDDGNFGSWTFVKMIATTTRGVSTSTPTRVRSDSFTPEDGKHYRIVASTTNASATYDIYNAKIIVDSTSVSVEDSYSESHAGPSTSLSSDGTQVSGQSFTSTGGSLDSAKFYLSKGGSPTGNAVAKLYAHSGTYGNSSVSTGAALATSDNFDVSTLTGSFQLVTFNFSGANRYAMTNGTNYIITIEYNAVASAVGSVFVAYDNVSPTHAGNQCTSTSVGSCGTAQSTNDNVFYVYGDFGNFTKLEPQYLVSNTTFGSGTSLQNFLTKWDSTEWSGVSNTYLHAVDSGGGSSVVELDTAGGTQITNSPVTASKAYATSTSALTMPASGNLDTKATTNAGDVYANRILVQTSQNVTIALSGSAYQSEGGSALANGTSISVYKNGSTLIGNTTTSGGTGAWSVSASSLASGDIVTAYIKDDATYKGVTEYVSDGTTKSDINIYGGALAVRNDTGTGITNANIQTGYVNDATNMVATTSGSTNLSVNSNIELHVWTGDTYTPGGTVTLNTLGTGNLHLDDSSTATIDTGISRIGGNIVVDTGATLHINASTNVYNGNITTAGTATVDTTSGTPIVGMLASGAVGGGSNALTFYGIETSSFSSVTFGSDVTITHQLIVDGSTSLTDSSHTVTMNNGSSISNSGTLTFNNLTIPASATVTTGDSFSVGGTLTVGSSATFAPSAGIITMTGGSITNSGTLTFNNLTIAGTVSTNSTFTVGGNLTASSGTLSGTGSITVNGGNITGDGTINMSGGTFLLDGTGTFGGNTAWTFNKLTFGDGSGVATSTSYGTGSITSATTTIAANQILDVGSKNWNLTAAWEPFQTQGTFLASTSLVSYQAANNATVTNATYYNLDISPSGGTPTFKLATTTGKTITVNGDFTMNGAGSATVDATTRDPILDVNGNMTIGTNATFQASDASSFTLAGSFTNNGTYTANNGTLTLDTTLPVTISSTNNITFYNMSVTTPGKIINFQKHTNNVPKFTFANNFTVTGGSGSPSNLITLQSATPGSQWLVNFSIAQNAITYAFVRDAACAVGSLSVAFSATNSGGGDNGSCWNIGNLGSTGSTTVSSVEQGSGGGTLRTGGGQGGGVGGGGGTGGGDGGGTLQGGGGQGGGGGGTP